MLLINVLNDRTEMAWTREKETGFLAAFISANAPRPTHWKYKIPIIGGIWLLAKYGYNRKT